MPTPFRWEEGNTAIHDNREWSARSYVVLEPAHAEKQHAREPGDLLHVLVNRPRPVREGHKPNGGRERTGEVGLCRTTCEPAEQGRETFGGGRGGKGTDRGEHRSISHVPDTERKRMSQGWHEVRQASPPLIHGKSRMRKRARTDLCGGRSAMVVPTATIITRAPC